MNKTLKLIISTIAVTALLLNSCFFAFAGGQDGISMGSISIDEAISSQNENSGSPIEETPIIENIEYSKIELTDDTRSFFATVDAPINITLVSSQTDFVSGDYLNYHYGYTSETLQHYYDVINILKTIAELNTNIKLNFIDPFRISSKYFMEDYEKHELKYGDIMLSCVVNFDGSFKTRNAVLRAESLFKFKANSNEISGVRIEKKLVSKLDSLRERRDINIAYIEDISLVDTFEYAKNYMTGKSYNIDNVTLQSEQLNGYDMIVICSPVRDITLEELVLIDNFLSLGGDRTFMYIAPKGYVKLNFLNFLVSKWGIAMDSERVLYTDDKKGYFSKTSQLYVTAHKSEYLNPSTISSNLIMENCTPITLLDTLGDLSVTTLMSTKSDEVQTTAREGTVEYERMEIGLGVNDTDKNCYPLATLSEKENGDQGKSRVLVFSSVDFITTYFALENNKTDIYDDVENGNLQLFLSVLNNINSDNRDKPSGLLDYAVKLAEKGIDTTSGYDTSYIITFGVVAVAVLVLIFITVILIFSRRKRNGK